VRPHAHLLVAGLVTAVLVACTPEAPPAPAPTPTPTATPTPDEAATGPSGGTLRYGIAEPTAIIPMDAVTEDDLLVVDALFDSLTTYDRNLGIIPGAAVAWSADDEQRVWTFRLREGARFHPPAGDPDGEGQPVTAADFAFAWSRAAAEGAAGFRLSMVEGYEEVARGERTAMSGVEAVDERTLRVTLAEPLGTFPAVVAHPSLAPLSQAAFLADEAVYREQPIGNGPFRAAEAWVRGQFIRAQRAPGWTNAPAPALLDEVLFQFGDPDTAYVAFQQGRLQISPLPQAAVPQAVAQYGESDDGYHGPGVLLGETPTLYFLGFNVEVAPYDDVEIRRAVSLAIDREALAATVGEGVVPADSLLAASLPNGRAGTCEACVHDPQAAEAILAEQGVQRLRLWFNRDGGHLPVARRIREDLAEVGVVLELQAQAGDLRTYLGELAEGGAGMFRFGWAPEHPVLDELLHPLFHSGQIGRRNYMRYAAADVDALIDEARAAPGALRRVFLSRRAEDLVLNRDQVIIPLLRYRHTQVVDERVQGYRLDAMGRANLAEVSLRG
jgi:oligopeptide transport system substrate-binding protein